MPALPPRCGSSRPGTDAGRIPWRTAVVRERSDTVPSGTVRRFARHDRRACAWTAKRGLRLAAPGLEPAPYEAVSGHWAALRPDAAERAGDGPGGRPGRAHAPARLAHGRTCGTQARSRSLTPSHTLAEKVSAGLDRPGATEAGFRRGGELVDLARPVRKGLATRRQLRGCIPQCAVGAFVGSAHGTPLLCARGCRVRLHQVQTQGHGRNRGGLGPRHGRWNAGPPQSARPAMPYPRAAGGGGDRS
jgi:hypothetical protein